MAMNSTTGRTRGVSTPAITNRFLPQFALTFSLALLSPLSADAQEGVVSRATCDRCMIDVGTMLVLGSADGVNGTLNDIARHENGTYYLSSLETRDVVEVYDSSGERQATIGRSGAGPGEFRTVYQLAVTDTFLDVFDADNLRWSRFTLTGQFVTATRIPGTPYSVAVVNDTAAVVNTTLSSEELAGVPLFLVTTNGSYQNGFGDNGSAFRFDQTFSGRREIAAAQGGVWAASKTAYRLELWSLDGTLRRVIVRDAAWFPRVDSWELPDAGGPPPTALASICYEPGGRLWVLSNVGDPRWHTAVQVVENEHGRRVVPDKLRLDQYWDSVIEVFDTQTAQLLSSHRFDPYATEFADCGHVAASGFRDGAPIVRVWPIHLRQQ